MSYEMHFCTSICHAVYMFSNTILNEPLERTIKETEKSLCWLLHTDINGDPLSLNRDLCVFNNYAGSFDFCLFCFSAISIPMFTFFNLSLTHTDIIVWLTCLILNFATIFKVYFAPLFQLLITKDVIHAYY